MIRISILWGKDGREISGFSTSSHLASLETSRRATTTGRSDGKFCDVSDLTGAETGDPPPFLFSIDLEDVRTMIPDGLQYCDSVPRLVRMYMEFLYHHATKCTFFTVGDIVKRYPDLVREIASEGHEIACHSSDHVPIPRQTQSEFRDDIARNIDALSTVSGGNPIRGFRAPTLSMTPETSWAYEVLVEAGIEYSSSVLPASNPLFGWPGFSRETVRVEPGIWEIPISLTHLPLLDVPFASGVYLRVLPLSLQRILYGRERRAGRPVVMYCHPFDLDTEQEYFCYPELTGHRFYNWLMYRGRAGVMRKLDSLLNAGGEIVPYSDYVSRLEPAKAVVPFGAPTARLPSEEEGQVD
jgi:polysaccharide deacetylase family protein (PEP-CTERM system associated)